MTSVTSLACLSEIGAEEPPATKRDAQSYAATPQPISTLC